MKRASTQEGNNKTVSKPFGNSNKELTNYKLFTQCSNEGSRTVGICQLYPPCCDPLGDRYRPPWAGACLVLRSWHLLWTSQKTLPFRFHTKQAWLSFWVILWAVQGSLFLLTNAAKERSWILEEKRTVSVHDSCKESSREVKSNGEAQIVATELWRWQRGRKEPSEELAARGREEGRNCQQAEGLSLG